MNTLLATDSKTLQTLITEPIYLVQERINYSHFEYEGENNKYVLVITPDALPTVEKEFLFKILAAVKLSNTDIALLNFSVYPGADIHQLKKFFACSKIILFGVSPEQLGIKVKSANFSILEYLNMAILNAESLTAIAPNQTKKTALWGALKQLFPANA